MKIRIFNQLDPSVNFATINLTKDDTILDFGISFFKKLNECFYHSAKGRQLTMSDYYFRKALTSQDKIALIQSDTLKFSDQFFKVFGMTGRERYLNLYAEPIPKTMVTSTPHPIFSRKNREHPIHALFDKIHEQSKGKTPSNCQDLTASAKSEYLTKNIDAFKEMKMLDLSRCQMPLIPVEIVLLNNLKTLYLNQNDLESLPPEIGNLTHLEELRIDLNNLRELPQEIGNLQHLKLLSAEENELSYLPQTFSNLNSLIELYLSKNQLSHLPLGFENLKQLTALCLANNQLAALPADFSNLTKLEELYLDENLLETLPEGFDHLLDLETFTLKNNPLNRLPRAFGKEIVAQDGDLLDEHFLIERLVVKNLCKKGQYGKAIKRAIALSDPLSKSLCLRPIFNSLLANGWRYPHMDGQVYTYASLCIKLMRRKHMTSIAWLKLSTHAAFNHHLELSKKIAYKNISDPRFRGLSLEIILPKIAPLILENFSVEYDELLAALEGVGPLTQSRVLKKVFDLLLQKDAFAEAILVSSHMRDRVIKNSARSHLNEIL